MPLYEDQLFSDTANDQAVVSPLVAQPGIGIGQEQAAAPVSDATRIAPLSRQQVNVDRRREEFSKLRGADRFFAGLGEFGAAVTGKKSPMDRQLEQQREDRLIKLQEFKIHAEGLQDGVKMVTKLRGEARSEFIEQYANQLEDVRPGLGDTFRALSKQPDMAQVLAKYSNKSPTLKRALEIDPSGDSALKMLTSADGMKTINAEIDSSVMPLLLQKGQTFKMGWQQLVSPDMAERFNRDGRISSSELMEANEWIKKNKPAEAKALAFSEEELQIIGRNQDAFYGTLGIATPKTEQDIIKKNAELKTKMQPGQLIDIPRGGKTYDKGAYDPEGSLFPKARHDENGFAILGTGTKEGTTINFPSSSGFGINPDTGKDGHYTIGKDGEIRWDKVAPPKKQGNPIQDAIAGLIKNPGAKDASKTKPILPAGVPAGSKLVGKTPEGKDVWEAPDKTRWVP